MTHSGIADIDEQPSEWIARFGSEVAPGASLLDVACGRGRHAKYFAARGVRVTAVDRDRSALASLRGTDGVVAEERELENVLWPYAAQSYDAVVVCNYLWRPSFEALLSTIKIGGVLFYETFMVGNQRFGKPSRPEFLLCSNELIERTRGDFRVLAYQEGEQRKNNGEAFAMKAHIFAMRMR